MYVQLGGNIKLGPTGSLVDVSSVVSSLTITTTRNSVTVPATLGTLRQAETAGAERNTVTIEFVSDFAAASLWAALWTAIHSASGELGFEGNFETGPTSTSNPKFSGTIVMLGLDTGFAAGQLRRNTIECPVTNAGVTMVTT